MTPEQMKALADAIRPTPDNVPELGDLIRAADLIESMAKREPLTDAQIADCVTEIKPYPFELVMVKEGELTAFVRAIEQAHGIRSEE